MTASLTIEAMIAENHLNSVLTELGFDREAFIASLPSRRQMDVAVRHRVWLRMLDKPTPYGRLSVIAVARSCGVDHTTVLRAAKKAEGKA